MSKTHNLSKTRQYAIWKGIKARCLNIKEPAYKNYGGRGIGICKEWLNFENFWNDMREGYRDDLCIDRIDNNGSYSKKNCRWVTREVQNMNKRNNIKYEIDGEQLLMKEIALKYNIGYKRLKARVERLKKTIDEAISMGNNKPKYYYYNNPRKKFIVEVTKFGGKIYGGEFRNEKDAKKKVIEILKSKQTKVI